MRWFASSEVTLRNEVTGLIATGIPPIVVILKELNELKGRVSEIIEKQQALPQKTAVHVKQMLEESFTVDGVALNKDMVQNMMDQMTAALKSEIRAISTTQLTMQPEHWDGKFHMVPREFRLPHETDMLSIIVLWIKGNVSSAIQPYRFLRSFDLPKLRLAKMPRS